MSQKYARDSELIFRSAKSAALRVANKAITHAAAGDFPNADKSVRDAYAFPRIFLQSSNFSPEYEREVFTLLETIDSASHTVNLLKGRAFA